MESSRPARQTCRVFSRDPGTWVAGESAYVHFINDRLRRRRLERCVSLPVVITRICHHAFNRCRRIIAFHPGCVATVVLWNNCTASIRIEEDFGRIETHSTRRIERSLSAITV